MSGVAFLFFSRALEGWGRLCTSGAEAQRSRQTFIAALKALRHPKSESSIAISYGACGRWQQCRFPGRGGWRRCRLRRLACRKRHFAALLLRARARGFSRGRLGGGLRGRWGGIRGNLFFRSLVRRLRKSLVCRRPLFLFFCPSLILLFSAS